MPAPYTDQTTASELAVDYASIIKGKIILVTGTSPSSIGFSFVQACASASPSLIILAGRSTAKLDETAKLLAAKCPSVKTRQLVIDLMSLRAVRKAAEEVNSWEDVPRIDVLCLNAGIMAVPYKLTEDGFESQLAANYLAHWLFTNLVMPKVLKSESPRVVSVASDGARLQDIRWADFNFDGGKTYNMWRAYGQSKTGNILMALSLAKKLGSKGLQAFSLHPGVIPTSGLSNHLPDDVWAGLNELDREVGSYAGFRDGFKFIDADTGAATHMFAAFDPNLAASNGAYLLECRVSDPYNIKDLCRPWFTSETEASFLWTETEKMLGQSFGY